MRIPRAFSMLFVAIGSGLVSAQALALRPAAPIIEISPTLPADIPGGANNANITQAAIFAWQEFIAENWPAEPGTRDIPDTEAKFGDPEFDGPLVWHTHRHKVEIYPGQGTPPGFDASAADFGYSAVPPKYVYGTGIGAADGEEGDGSVPPCPGQTPVETPAFINLDEISQIGLNQVFSGAAPSVLPDNKDPQLIRFLAKGNKMHYLNAVDPNSTIPGGDPLYTHPQPCPTDASEEGYNHTYCVAKRNFQAVSMGGTQEPPVTTLPGPVVDFPSGTIMVKGAWRELTEKEQARGKFYQTTVRYYEDNDENPGTACYRESIWGLYSLHIIHKTPSAPTFIFATYEHKAILLTPTGRRVENANGRVVRRNLPAAATTPALSYEDGTPPILEIIPEGTEYCLEPGKRLFYQENPEKTGLPSNGNICQNYRFFDIPPAIRRVNRAAHRAIRAYNRENGLESSVWLNYRLTNVQWLPFDTTEVNDDDPDRGLATYYLSDAAIETDYTLQQFKGRIDMTGPPTSMPANFASFNGRQTYQNTLQFEGNDLTETSNMGGCMGCHGIAQLGGNQFSFILGGGRVAEPDAPGVTPPGSSNPTPIIPVEEPESGI